jgi:hypothetical protein
VRDHLRQHALEYLAVFIALSGTAYATGTQRANTVASIDIINGEVKTVDLGADAVTSSKVLDGVINSADVLDNSLNGVDVRNGQVASIDVANGSLTGADVADNGLTGADLDESSLDLATETWHEIGAAGEPTFATGSWVGFASMWENFDSAHNSAAFYRDRAGIVHLKGLVEFVPVPDCFCVLSDQPVIPWTVFTLPPGYQPAARELQLTLQQGRRAGIDLMPDGRVILELIDVAMGKNEWFSLDGISFRAGA